MTKVVNLYSKNAYIKKINISYTNIGNFASRILSSILPVIAYTSPPSLLNTKYD